jgi:immune inhibitor A
MSRIPAQILAAAALLAVLSCCCCPAWDPSGVWEWLPTDAAEATSSPTPTSDPGTGHVPTGVPDEITAETLQLLDTTEIPIRDLHELNIRLGEGEPLTPRTVNPNGSPDYPVGTRRLFSCSNLDTDQRFDVYAVLEYKTDHLYMWIDEDVHFDPQAVAEAAEMFEQHVYPTNREFFGSEWTPGVDNDPHLSVLHTGDLGYSVLGYYSAADEYVTAVRQDSNEMEMFYINTDTLIINSSDYNATLAHEFQHMIRWHQDQNEETWMDEGFAELASALNGFDTVGHSAAFAYSPDNQLNSFDYEAGDATASYGSAYLFTAYFLDRFGEEATRSLADRPEDGLDAVDAALEEIAPALTHEDVFADWVLANFLDDPTIAGGEYGYRHSDPPFFRAEDEYDERDLPVSESAQVHQYAADYVGLNADRPLLFRFRGSTSVRLTNTDAHSGLYSWYSNRAEDSDTTLTQSFDLSGVSAATLEYWAWYDIEENWDYAYLEISTDGGDSWKIIRAPHCTTENPNLSSYGCAYTGRSGDSQSVQWIRQVVDLSPYAGGQVVLRFEYITDEAVNQPGLLLDDIAIPEIGYESDFELDDGGWEAAGFVRTANGIPQEWILQLVVFGGQTTVERLELAEDGTGEWLVPLGGTADRAVVAICAAAPVTTEAAPYLYDIELH